MKNTDRFLLLFLVVGLWGLVLQPTVIDAHSHEASKEHEHKHMRHKVSCNISGTAYGSGNSMFGEMSVEVYNFDGVRIKCQVKHS